MTGVICVRPKWLQVFTYFHEKNNNHNNANNIFNCYQFAGQAFIPHPMRSPKPNPNPEETQPSLWMCVWAWLLRCTPPPPLKWWAKTSATSCPPPTLWLWARICRSPASRPNNKMLDSAKTTASAAVRYTNKNSSHLQTHLEGQRSARTVRVLLCVMCRTPGLKDWSGGRECQSRRVPSHGIRGTACRATVTGLDSSV